MALSDLEQKLDALGVTKRTTEQLLATQQQYVNYFFDNVKAEQIDFMLEQILNCKGMIFFTGVGKSGIVARKLAVTFTSIGTRSLFISPMDAVHGDLGIVTPDDLVIFISKSGESDELVTLLPFVRNRGVTTIAWVSSLNSRLAQGASYVVYLPLERELCPYNMAPTTSVAIQMILGDILAVALMEAKDLDLCEYGENHPAGKIGKSIHFKVKDLMIQGDDLPVCHHDDRLVDLLVEISNKKCGCLMVCDKESQLLGIFTDGDLRRALQSGGSNALENAISSLMTANPRTIDPEMLAAEAKELMQAKPKSPITVLPVIEEGKVVGLLRMHDLLQAGL